jgi:hypothetical protein
VFSFIPATSFFFPDGKNKVDAHPLLMQPSNSVY